jgi:hypothetical protein
MRPVIAVAVQQTSHQPYGHVITFCGLTWETCYSESLRVHWDETSFSAGHAHHVGTSSQTSYLPSWFVLQASWTVVVLRRCIFSSFVGFRADVQAWLLDAPITRVWACRWLSCFLFDKRAGRKWHTVLGRSSVPVEWTIGVETFMPILVSARPRCHRAVLKPSNNIS